MSSFSFVFAKNGAQRLHQSNTAMLCKSKEVMPGVHEHPGQNVATINRLLGSEFLRSYIVNKGSEVANATPTN